MYLTTYQYHKNLVSFFSNINVSKHCYNSVYKSNILIIHHSDKMCTGYPKFLLKPYI